MTNAMTNTDSPAALTPLDAAIAALMPAETLSLPVGAIRVYTIRSKGFTRGGKLYAGSLNEHARAEIIPGVSIRIFGVDTNRVKGPQAYDFTFKVGDIAEYHAYNMSYFAPITSITAKRIGFKSENRSLDLYDFVHHNDEDRAAKVKRNQSWSD